MTGPDAASPLRPDALRLRDLLRELPAAVVLGAMFPRFTYGWPWRSRLGLRGRLVFTAVYALWLFAVSTWLMPYMRRKAQELEGLKDDLRRQLGREPTDDEYVEHVMRAREG